jgi:hypothetical protein
VSDLSRLLDDVYGDPGTSPDLDPMTPPTTDDAGADGVPEWGAPSDHDAFAGWDDHTGDDPTGDDRQAGGDGEPTAAVDALPPTTAMPLGASRSFFTELTGASVEAPAADAVAEAEAASGWHRSDDDILPTSRARGGRRARRAGAPVVVGAGAAPTIEDFAADPSSPDAPVADAAEDGAAGHGPKRRLRRRTKG